MASFAYHGHRVERLCLDKVAFLDLRLLTQALEHLPSLEMLAIDSCELLNMGSLVSMLDIIHWFGTRRGNEFIKLDFFPKAWFGPKRNRTATSVLTFQPPIEPRGAQGVMVASLVAMMKSAYMGYDIVPENSLLEKFLYLVPMEFGLMAFFISEVKKLIKCCEANGSGERGSDNFDQCVQQILAALMRPSRGFDQIRTDEFMPSLSSSMMHECGTCKHKFVKFLLHPSHWTRPSNHARCMSCCLLRIIEAEDHAWLIEKRKVVDSLFAFITVALHDFVPPNQFDQICPVIDNPFVRHPKPEEIPDPVPAANATPEAVAAQVASTNRKREAARRRWLIKMSKNLLYGKFASPQGRNMHLEQPAQFIGPQDVWRAALLLDSRNRYAEAIGMHLDDSEWEIQPRRCHYPADAAWEGVYGQNVGAQGFPRPAADRYQWA